MSPIYEPGHRASFARPREPATEESRSISAATDEELIRGLTGGGKKGFAAFYDRLAPALFSLTCQILGDDKEAEAALQDAFVQMSRDSSSFDRATGSLFSWAVMITRSEALTRLRQRPSSSKASEALGFEIERERYAPLHSLDRNERERVTRALAALPPPQREIVALAFFGGISLDEISSRLQVPVAGVKASLGRGLNALRDAAAASATSSVTRAAPQLHRTAAADFIVEETKNMTSPPKNNERAEAFDSFVEKNFPPLYRFAFCMSLAPESAAHLVESAFAQAQRAQRNRVSPAIDKHWLLSAMHHDWLAAGSRSGAHMPFALAPVSDPLIQANHIAGFDQAGVIELLHGMKQELRLVLSLFYFERLSYGEIAVILDIPATTVLAHLSEAKTVLRRQLEQKRASDQSGARPPVSKPVDSPSG